MHTIKVAVIDVKDAFNAFDVEDLRNIVRGRLDRLDPLRYQLIGTPMKCHHPMWRENCAVDLGFHVRSLKVVSPGGRHELEQAVGRIASTQLDRARPLWEVYLLEGLADGRKAVVGKIHHALADGVACENLMGRAMDPSNSSQQGNHSSRRVAHTADPIPTRRELLRLALRDHLRQLSHLPPLVGHTVAGIVRVRRNRQTFADARTRSSSPPPSFINHTIDSQRRFATTTLSLADIKETSKQLGVSVNDLVLAMSAGALRQLLLKYGGSAEESLQAMVPVSLDFSPDRISGNHFSGVKVPLPTDSDDPLERVRRIRSDAMTAKQTLRLLGPELISRWAAYLPPAAAEALSRWLARRDGQNKLFSLPISNVKGPSERGRVNGALVTEIYSVGPLSAGSGLNITVWSYVDQLNISVLADGGTVDDPHELSNAMIDEFVKIRSAAGISERLLVVEIAMS